MKISFLQLCIIVILFLFFFGNFRTNQILKKIQINKFFNKIRKEINNINLSNTNK